MHYFIFLLMFLGVIQPLTEMDSPPVYKKGPKRVLVQHKVAGILPAYPEDNPGYVSDPPENCHLTVKKLPKT